MTTENNIVKDGNKMSMYFRYMTAALLVVVLALPLAVAADDHPESYDDDAKYAEDAPPVIPHPVEDNASGEDCLACHKEGLNGAPLSPHAIRINCTQCHVRSDLSDPKKHKKDKKDKKKKRE